MQIAPGAGAYHGAELAVLFGVTETFTGAKDTDAEAKTGMVMRRAWSTFAKNPRDGLTSELGWPRYDPSGILIFP